MKGAYPPQRPTLYAKVFTVLKCRVKRKSFGMVLEWLFVVVETSKMLIHWKLKRLVPVLIVESNWRVTSPHPRPPFPQLHPIKILRSSFCLT